MGLTTQGGKGCVNKKDSLQAADSLTWSQFSLRKTIGSSEEHARNRPQQLCATVQLELTTATSVQNLQMRARMKQVFVLFPRKTDGHLSGETCRPSLTVATTGLSPAPDDKDRKLRGYTSRTSCMHDDSIGSAHEAFPVVHRPLTINTAGSQAVEATKARLHLQLLIVSESACPGSVVPCTPPRSAPPLPAMASPFSVPSLVSLLLLDRLTCDR